MLSTLPNSTSLLRDWIGYSAIDVLVIRETFLTERHISKAQQTALLDWVQRGGTLIMSGGSSFNYLQGSFIEPFLPVQLKGMKKTNTLPTTLHEQLDTAIVQSFGETTKIFEYIEFTPKAGMQDADWHNGTYLRRKTRFWKRSDPLFRI